MRSGLVLSSFAALALALASPALAQQAPTGTPMTQMPAQGQLPPPGQMAMPGQIQQQKLSQKGEKFAKEAAMGGMAEVALGKLAQQNSQDDEVKEFGARMVQDHGAANRELMAIVAAKDFSVPQQLDQKHKQVVDKLSKMRGAEFDRAYMKEMVEDHDKTVKKFRQAAQNLDDANLKTFAQKTLPILEQHQQMAHELSRSLTAVGSGREPQGNRNR